MNAEILRPEALPFRNWKTLTKSQQRAFTRLVNFLSDAVARLDHHRPVAQTIHSDRSALDFHRANQVVMVSGKRGTGKTSLFLTLRYLLNPNLSMDESDLPNNLRTCVSDLSRRVIWLETLDLEPLPRQSSLLAAIIARIEEAVREEHGDWSSFDSWVDHERQTGVQLAISEFERLANDIAFAWEDAPHQELRSIVELETYAINARRAEKARLSVRFRLEKVLDLFAQHVRWRNNVTKPLFILPVDDFDLNPRRSLDVLRLLRGVGNARIFPIILGDIDVARMIVELKMQGELGAVYNGVRLDPDQQKNLSRESRGLAAEAIRKLLPPDQRLYLTPLSIEEVMELTPLDFFANRSQSLPSSPRRLVDLIRAISEQLTGVNQPKVAPSLEELLGTERHVQGEDSKAGDFPLPAGGRLLLGTVRENMDRWLAFDRILDGNPSDFKNEILRLFWRELYQYLISDERLPDTWRSELQSDRLEDLQAFPPFPMTLVSRHRSFEQVKLDFPQFDIEFSESLNSDIVSTRASEESSTSLGLAESTKNSLCLFHDLATTYTTSFPVYSMTQYSRIANFVKVQWNYPGEEWAIEGVGQSDRTGVIYWPTPPFTICYAFETFCDRWNRLLRLTIVATADSPNLRMEVSALNWILLDYLSLFERNPELAYTADTEFRAFETHLSENAIEIENLVGILSILFGRTAESLSPKLVQSWWNRVFSILAPECLPTINLAKTMLSEKYFENRLERDIEAIKSLREKTLKSLPARLESLLGSPTIHLDNTISELRKRKNFIQRMPQNKLLIAAVPNLANILDPLNQKLIDALSDIERVFQNPSGKNSKRKPATGMTLEDRFAERLKDAKSFVSDLSRKIEELDTSDESDSEDEQAFRIAIISEIRQPLEQVRGTVTLIESSFELQRFSLDHPINTFNNRSLCVD